MSSLRGFCIYIGGFVGYGGSERQACQTVAGKYPVIGITETDIGIGVFYIVDFHGRIHRFQYESRKLCIVELKIMF